MQIINPVTGGGASLAPMPVNYLNGFSTFFPGLSNSGVPYAAAEGYVYRIRLNGPATLTAALDVTSAGVAGSKAAVAIYAVAANGAFGAKVSTFTEFDVSTTGLMTAGSTLIPAGEYWVYEQVSAACSLRTVTVTPTSIDNLSYSDGGTTIGAPQSQIKLTNAYAFPTPAGGAITVSAPTNGNCFPFVFFRIS